jgi:xylose isomerase
VGKSARAAPRTDRPFLLTTHPKNHTKPSTQKTRQKNTDDYDVATTLAFLRKHGLEGTYTLNIECNHATLSGHSCEHEVVTASADGAWASFDANTGDPQLGWDTDEFLTDPHETTRVMLALLRQGGWPRAKGRGAQGRGGINFDAKLRRESVDPSDLVLAHVSGIDALARGLRSAARLLEEGKLDALVADRYASWKEKGGIAERVLSGRATLPELEAWALKHQDLAEDVRSGRQEMAELLVARAIV